MKPSAHTPVIRPPRLSPDAYADFIEASLRTCDRARALRQKKIEERIRVPFRISPPGRDAKPLTDEYREA